MSKLEGGVGTGAVLVFQPATPTGTGLPIALGIQRFWQKTLKESGRPARCVMAMTRVEAIEGTPPDGMPIAVGDRGVANIGDWADRVANAVLVRQQDCRWGLIATLRTGASDARLDTELIEVRGDAEPQQSESIATWSFEGPFQALPAHVYEVLVETARRVGTRIASAGPAEAFDTDDPGAAMFLLEQMGVLSMAEDGVRLVIAGVLDRLAVLAGLEPRSSRVVALVPELLGHLARLGAHDLQIAAWLRKVRSASSSLPPEWDGLLETIRRSRMTEPTA